MAEAKTAEQKANDAAAAALKDPPAPDQVWLYPFDLPPPPPATGGSRFGIRKHPVTGETQFHNGVDWSVAEGTPLLAVAQGKVARVLPPQLSGGGGLSVILALSDGYTLSYCHMSAVNVTEGQAVQPRQLLGLSGGRKGDPNAGMSTGPHLHFGVRYKEVWTDPEKVYQLCLSALKYPCPLDAAGMPPNLWKHFANNEGAKSGIGGYFAIGLRRNFHGGVHLFPTPPIEEGTPVRALAPGYVVAARLPGIGSKGLSGDALRHIGNWPGFVLLRHQLQEVKKDSNAASRSGSFYSLYMHLKPARIFAPAAQPPGASSSSRSTPAPPVTIDADDSYFKQVPWYRSLVERRFGAFVNVLQERPTDKKAIPRAPGKIVWSAEVVEAQGGKPTKAKYRVLGELKEIELAVSAPAGANASAPDGPAPGTLRWLYKPSPMDVSKVVDALAAGDVVTFGEPFLPVGAGEPIGFVAPCPAAMEGRPLKVRCKLKNAAGEPVTTTLTFESGFLHWQVFAPAKDDGTNGIALLLDLAKKVTEGVSVDPSLPTPQAPAMMEISDDGDDNFIELEEMENKLKPALPAQDREGFAAAFKGLDNTPKNANSYARPIIEMLDSNTSFGPRPDRVDWEVGCKYKYPILLQLEEQGLMAPDENPLATEGKYTLTFEFERSQGSSSTAIVCDASCDRPSCTGLTGNDTGNLCRPRPFEIDAALYNSHRDAEKHLVSFTLMVPAEADRVRVKLSGGIVGIAGAPVKGAELLLLTDALRERWRNTRVRHINEWSIQSFRRIEEKLRTHFDIAPEAFDVAWCDPEKEVAIGRTVLGASDEGLVRRVERQAIELFNSDSKALLPANGKVDDLHPITAAWLLNLLEKQKKAQVVDGWKAKPFQDEDAKPLAVGWVADVRQPQALVGGSVYAVVVDDDFGYDPSLKVKVVARGPRTLELASASYASGGVVVLPVDICFWGDWTIDTEPSARKNSLFGVAKLSIPALEFDTLTEAEVVSGLNDVRANKTFSWIVKVKRPVRAVYGVVSMQTRREGGSWPAATTREAVMVPATAVASIPPTTSEGEAVPKDADLLIEQGGFIRGLNPTKKKTDAVISEGLSLSDYRKAATDFKVAFSLLEALLSVRQKTDKLTVESIALDGLSLRIRPQVAKGKAEATSKGPTLLEAAVSATSGLPGLQAFPEGDALGHVRLVCPPAAAKQLGECPILKGKARALVSDATGVFVLDAKESSIAGFPVSELRSAYLASSPFRLSLALAKALHVLRQQLKSISLSHLSLDGMSCRIANSVEQGLTLARASGLFLMAEIDKKELHLTVNPEPERFLSLNFDPAPMLEHLMRRPDVRPGEKLEYRFFFETVNGLHYLFKPNEGGWPLDMRQLGAEHFDELVRRGGRRETFGPSNPARRAFSKLAFKEPTLTWMTKNGVPCLLLESEALGEVETWQSFRLKISRTSGSGGVAAVKGAEALKPPTEAPMTILFPIPVIESDKAFLGQVTVKLEAVAVVSGATPPLPVQVTFNCAPRWGSPMLQIDASSPTELKVRCVAMGMEVPEMVNGHAVPAKTSREFVLNVVELSPPPSSPPVSRPLSSGRNARPQKKDPPTVFYANPSERRHGYLTADGVFEARIPRLPARGVIPLENGATYKLTLERPGGSKVRGVDPEPKAPFATFP